MITAPCLCTREDVMSALDIKLTARQTGQVDRAVQSAVGIVTGQLHRSFIPWTGTRYFDWPGNTSSAPWILRLDQHELVSVTRLEAGGIVIPESDYFLEPNGSGPPYTRIEVNIATQSAFSSGPTTQRAIAVTGTFAGCPLDTAPAGTLDGAISSTAVTCIVTDSAALGVGDVLVLGTERLLATDKRMTDTGVTLAAALTASANDVVLTVSSSSGAPTEGELLLVDGERMLVVDAAGTTLTVKRAYDGSTLATHASGAAVYAPRLIAVMRGISGTTAAAHDDGAAISRHLVPPLIRQLAAAEALTQVMQEGAGWARMAGAGDNQREVLSRGLGVLRDQAYTAYGRKARIRAV